MAKKLGRDYRLFVQSAVAGTFTQPLGQGNLSIDRGKSFTSNATKDTEGIDTQQPNLRTLTIKQDLTPDLPDPAYTRIETLDKSNAAEVYQIRKRPWANTDVVFECSMYTALDSTGFDDGGASVKAPITLQPAAVPTVDALA